MPDYTDVKIENTTLSAEAYSNIFTDVLSKSGDVNINKLYNDKISVYVSTDGANIKDKFNNPALIGADAATLRLNDGKIRVSAIIRATGDDADNRYLYSTVSNVQNLLGAHEYTGHGIKGWKDSDYTHYKAYDFQMNHKSWNKTTGAFKNEIRKSAKIYEYMRNVRK
jgi:hypothetical protein